MTIRQWSEKYCTDRGMWDDDARTVIDTMIADDKSGAMDKRWDDVIDAYPSQLLGVLAIRIDQYAIGWIDANQPEAWYRPIFAVGVPSTKGGVS